jgi:hypothetical protein
MKIASLPGKENRPLKVPLVPPVSVTPPSAEFLSMIIDIAEDQGRS